MPTFNLYGLIDSAIAEKFAKFLEVSDKKEPLTLRVNSPGGSVFAGFSIFNLIRSLPLPTTVIVDGLAASMAAIIPMAAARVVMNAGTFLMLHDPSIPSGGNIEEMENSLDLLKKIKKEVVKVLVGRTKRPESEIEEMLTKKTWFSPQEALEVGLVDVIDEKTVANLAESFAFSDQFKAPECVVQGLLFKAKTEETIMENEKQEKDVKVEQKEPENRKEALDILAFAKTWGEYQSDLAEMAVLGKSLSEAHAFVLKMEGERKSLKQKAVQNEMKEAPSPTPPAEGNSAEEAEIQNLFQGDQELWAIYKAGVKAGHIK